MGRLRMTLYGIGGLAVPCALAAWSALFIVPQTHNALVLQFGDIRRVVIASPGLHAKLPVIQNVIYIDRRILDLDSPAEEVIAADQKRLVVDAFTRYRITDPRQFYITLQSGARASSRLNALVNSTIRSVLGKQPFFAIVRDNRAGLMQDIRDQVSAQAKDFGIEVVDVRIRRADLPEANSQAIFRRMQTERQQEAAEIRAIGQENARQIRAEAEKQTSIILAAAYRDAEIIRGQGDGCRNRIFARAFGQDEAFFNFYRSMQSYEHALEGSETSLVLSPESEFFRFFLNPEETQNKQSSPPSRALSNNPELAPGAKMRDIICPEIEPPQASAAPAP